MFNKYTIIAPAPRLRYIGRYTLWLVWRWDGIDVCWLSVPMHYWVACFSCAHTHKHTQTMDQRFRRSLPEWEWSNLLHCNWVVPNGFTTFRVCAADHTVAFNAHTHSPVNICFRKVVRGGYWLTPVVHMAYVTWVSVYILRTVILNVRTQRRLIWRGNLIIWSIPAIAPAHTSDPLIYARSMHIQSSKSYVISHYSIMRAWDV